MAPLIEAEVNAMATAEAARLVAVSLHTANPGTNGASEATGGNPAYARRTLVWGTAAAGSTSATEVTFDVPAGTYTHFGYWSAATGGTFRGGNPLATAQTLSSQGQLKLTVTLPVTAA